jgi:ACS family allantoate permease-like MFS transporter
LKYNNISKTSSNKQDKMSNATTADVKKDMLAMDNTSPSPPPLTKIINTKLLKHSHDADAAMKAFEGTDGQVVELSEEKNKALLRKIDWHLMPVSVLGSQICC